MTAFSTWSARIGQRVAIRYRTDAGTQSDLVGELTAVDDSLHVSSLRGPVRVRLDQVLAGKVVPPRPTRPGPAHLVISVTDLQRVMALHWQPLETEHLGGWRLRASQGFTGRANSVLPLGDPGLELPAALATAVDWYAARSLPPKIAVAGPVEAGDPPADPRVDADAGPAAPARRAALTAGWRPVEDWSALVLTVRTADLCRTLAQSATAPAPYRVTVDPRPDEAWLANYRYRGQELPPVALGLLTSAPEQVFVSVRDGDTTVGVARGSLGGGWAGITGVEVLPERRRQGLGTVLLATVADWARRSGATCLYLQVGVSNLEAASLYRRAGFAVHHRYDYLQAPLPHP